MNGWVNEPAAARRAERLAPPQPQVSAKQAGSARAQENGSPRAAVMP
jgi:hypothetical protein